MKDIRENELVIKYSTMLENELDKFINHSEELNIAANVIKEVAEWKFAKDGNILYPQPFFNEIMGHKTGKFTNKKFSSLQEASEKGFCIYGIDTNKNHIITIDSSSHQFGSFLRCFIYDGELIKMLPIRFSKSYLKEDEFHFDETSLPNIRNLVYFFWLEPNHQVILSKGLNNTYILIDQITYKDSNPEKYITNRIEDGEIQIISFDFIYKDNKLEMIKHDSSEYMLYSK